jgi:hypothetical protein
VALAWSGLTVGSLPKMVEHVHVHPPHELEESSRSAVHRERFWELMATFLLAIATVGIAWGGYQAARWSGLQAERYAQANTARSEANRVSTRAGQDRLQDLVNFNRWLEVSTEGNAQLASLYQRRFLPEFQPAFQAWVAQDPLNNPKAIASPLLMPQYHPAGFTQANRLEHQGDVAFDQAKSSTDNTDAYVLTTVFFAAVLFFAGISLRFQWAPLRACVVAFAAVFLTYGLARFATLPIR